MWPQQIPPDVLANPLRSTEVEVYRTLASQLDDTWWIFYSRPWFGLTATGDEKDGECDFVVAHAARGVLCIEVKGGAVGWNAHTDQWTSRDRHGITHKIKDPVSQARSSKYALLDKLKRVRGLEDRYFRMRHGVVLPDCVNPGHDLGPDRPMRIFCFSDAYPRHLADWVESRFRQDPDDPNEQALGVDGIYGLRDLLAKPFQLDVSLGAVIRAEDRKISFLTQQQFQLLDSIEGLPRVLVAGGAGTGKTVLAVRLAQNLAAQGRRTLLVCYSRPLAERLAMETKNVGGLNVQSFHQLCGAVISGAGNAVPSRGPDRQEYFDVTLPAAAEAFSSSPSVQKYEAIIVDEGQDFCDIWWLLIDALLDREGPGLLRVFADSNQRVYGDVGRLKRDLQLAPIRLSWNLRNTQAIHEAAYRHYQGTAVTCNGPEGEAPRVVEVAERSKIPEEVARIVQLLVRHHDISPEDVAVLVPKDVWRKDIAKGGRLAALPVADAASRQEGSLIVDTVRRFKGLESLVTVIVVDAELGSNEELAYVALSRARTRNYVVGQPRHLKPVLAAATFRA